ncbi:MAG: prepilin-type N-terminal cleavage/methylation domain-containing protein [Phycisphaeraceae bacterium]|nr:prepilin-type N-terminal cleavage/methylation domain-containing protein [Phycisphaerales bacterium]MCB9859828.1 prepilin-type N-terminal cleavage/methylation domain-containing protein [Phycisphaeraceae bacterium]
MKQWSSNRAFSLIELVVVIVVIGVIVSIAIPRMASATSNSRTNAAQFSVREFNCYIETYYTDYSAWPSLSINDFAGRIQHPNPFAPEGAAVLEQPTGLSATDFHPTAKTTSTADNRAGWWYNNASGSFRGRVSAQGNDARTINLYNTINGCSISAIAQTAK